MDFYPWSLLGTRDLEASVDERSEASAVIRGEADCRQDALMVQCLLRILTEACHPFCNNQTIITSISTDKETQKAL